MFPFRILLAAGITFCLIATASAQDFVLENPADPAAASTAAIIGTDLVVTDAGGRKFVYQRRPDLDTPDGLFQGFFSPAASQYLRWPVSGSGSMQVGRVAGTTVMWSLSRMQIRVAAGGPLAGGTFIPGGPLHVGALPLGPKTTCAAQIDSAGQLQFFIGHGERWRHIPSELPPGTLVPGAPVQLAPHPGAPVPRVFTIGANGRFLQISGGGDVQEIPGHPGIKFVPGGQFATVQTATGSLLFASDRHGRLWRLDLAGGKHQTIEGHLGVLESGVPISVMADGAELFMTDRKGAIVVYSLDPMGMWHGPEIVAPGFTSRGVVTAWTRPGTMAIELAAVDHKGYLQVLRYIGGAWKKDTVPDLMLPAGSPVTAFETTAGLSLTAVTAEGGWLELFETGGKWQRRLIGDGFPPRAPLAFSSYGPMLFATDITGRLISAIWTGSEWHAVICAPSDFPPGAIGMAPRLVSRKTILNRRIDPITIELQNTTPEELVVRVLDARIPGKVQELALPPNGSVPLRADRDAGGTLEEVYLVPGPGGPVQQVRQIPLPPQKFYDIMVYTNRVTYQYIDRRKQKGPVPNFNETSLVSLGAFPLPPDVSNGARLDVYGITTATRNPGAAAVLDP
jgi:hypothetical protein